MTLFEILTEILKKQGDLITIQRSPTAALRRGRLIHARD